MLKKTMIMMIIISQSLLANSKLWITTGTDMAKSAMRYKSFQGAKVLAEKENVTLMKLPAHQILQLSHNAHREFKRCGGYIVHETKEDALAYMNNEYKNFNFFNYEISQQELVNELIPKVDELKIVQTIIEMSKFHNRYYTNEAGTDSQNWLAQQWRSLSASRSDAKVELVEHKSWPQPSVVLTIEGSDLADEIVIIGGHADSINGTFFARNRRAPGADDNASGIASITEVIRVLLENGFQPRRTLQFMAYAAEEVGLRGSGDIAKKYREQNKQVVGVLQLDMTNFQGNPNLDIALVNDFTNEAQNKFIGKLIDEYLQYSWDWTKCGYACSDHASWNRNGFPASFPFEADKRNINSRIHTRNDTIARSNDNASHAAKFSRLALSYLVELSQ